VQELRDVAVRVRLDRHAERAVAVRLRARHGEHTHAAAAVDLDAELHVLAGNEATPGAVRPDHDGTGVAGLVDDLHDAAAHLVDGEEGVEMLEVVVDGVGRGQRPDGSGTERASDEAHASTSP
jgi:hypothetical protein